MTVDKGIFIKNIFYMLSYAFQELGKNTYEDIAGEKFDEIHDLLAEILSRGVSSLLKQGLHRRYIPKEEVLSTLRGKLDMSSTMRLYSRGVKRLACEYDEYCENNLFNQILRTTMSLLATHTSVKPERQKSLRKLLPFFDNVDSLDIRNVKWSAMRFDRNSRAYYVLMSLCNFIVDNKILSTDAGDIRMHTFMDEHMCRLFEKFVLEYYRRHHRELNPCARQIAWNVDEKETTMELLPALQTDIFLTDGDRTLIIDTKYYSKSMQIHYNKHTIHSHNQNQILTYVMNHDGEHTGKTDGMLLYARTDEEIYPDGKMKWRDGNMIYYRSLDLNQDFEGIRKELENIIATFLNPKQSV